MAEINTSPGSNHKKKSFSKSINRRSTSVDLTPMVDLGFLLITFFVFTTAMSTSKVMDMNETEDGPPKKIMHSAVMTILIGKDHELLYYYGKLDSLAPGKQIIKTGFKEIRQAIIALKRRTDPKQLMYIIKAGDHATFGDEMNIMDEMLICGIPAGHYAEAELTTTETDLISTGK